MTTKKAPPVPAVRESTTPASPAAPGSTFVNLMSKLVDADLKARSTAADAGQARAERSRVAVETITAAFYEAWAPESVRTALLDAGVLKGTVSKIVTVLVALNDGKLALGNVKSLNGAYNLVKANLKAALAAAMLSTATPPPAAEPPEPATAPKYATTPDEALEVIIDSIKAERDPDKAFKLGGEWITKITNEITATLKAKGDGSEEEE